MGMGRPCQLNPTLCGGIRLPPVPCTPLAPCQRPCTCRGHSGRVSINRRCLGVPSCQDFGLERTELLCGLHCQLVSRPTQCCTPPGWTDTLHTCSGALPGVSSRSTPMSVPAPPAQSPTGLKRHSPVRLQDRGISGCAVAAAPRQTRSELFLGLCCLWWPCFPAIPGRGGCPHLSLTATETPAEAELGQSLSTLHKAVQMPAPACRLLSGPGLSLSLAGSGQAVAVVLVPTGCSWHQAGAWLPQALGCFAVAGAAAQACLSFQPQP